MTVSSTLIYSLGQKMSFDCFLFTLTLTHPQTAYSCGDLLRECWWRSRQINCCELFTMSKSEYGYCYSFNSQAAPRTQYEKVFSWCLWHTESNSFATISLSSAGPRRLAVAAANVSIRARNRLTCFVWNWLERLHGIGSRSWSFGKNVSPKCSQLF